MFDSWFFGLCAALIAVVVVVSTVWLLMRISTMDN